MKCGAFGVTAGTIVKTWVEWDKKSEVNYPPMDVISQPLSISHPKRQFRDTGPDRDILCFRGHRGTHTQPTTSQTRISWQSPDEPMVRSYRSQLPQWSPAKTRRDRQWRIQARGTTVAAPGDGAGDENGRDLHDLLHAANIGHRTDIFHRMDKAYRPSRSYAAPTSAAGSRYVERKDQHKPYIST